MAGGPGQPQDGARHRALASKAFHLHARAVHRRARSAHKHERAVHPRARSRHRWVQLLLGSAWNSLAFLSGPMSPEVSGRISTRSTNRQALNAVLTKAWPYDGKYRAAYGESPSGTRFGLVAGCRKCTPALGSALLPSYVSVGKRFGTGGKTGSVPLPN